MRTAIALATGVLVTVSSLTACTTSGRLYVGQVSHDAAKSAVEGAAEGVGSLPEPLRRALRETLLADDTLPQVSHRVAEATVRGVHAGLSAPETQKYIDDVVSRTMARLGRDGGEATTELIRAIEPQLSESLRRALSGMNHTLAEDIDRDLAPRARAMAQATADALVKTLAAGFEVQLAAIRQTARDIGRELISEAATSMDNRKDVLGAMTDVAVSHALRSVRMSVMESLPDHVPPRLIAALLVFAGLAVLSVGGLVVYWWRYRQSAKSLTIIAQQINDFQATELKQAIRESTRANYVGPWFSNFLKHRGL